ncbi:MAG: hypothetical protein ACYCPS_03275 [Candidatus Saccharimonadales bacterium]
MSVPISRGTLKQIIESARDAEEYLAKISGQFRHTPDESEPIGFGEIGDDEYFGR